MSYVTPQFKIIPSNVLFSLATALMYFLIVRNISLEFKTQVKVMTIQTKLAQVVNWRWFTCSMHNGEDDQWQFFSSNGLLPTIKQHRAAVRRLDVLFIGFS